MDIKEEVKKMFPYYEDMNDIEIVQTNAKRNCAIQIFEWLEQHLSEYQIRDYNYRKMFAMIVQDFKNYMKNE